MKQTRAIELLAVFALAMSIPLTADAWVAAGPRGVAAGGDGAGVAYGHYGGEAAWDHGVGVAHGAYGGEAAWSHGYGVAHGAYGGEAVRGYDKAAVEGPHGNGAVVTPHGAVAW